MAKMWDAEKQSYVEEEDMSRQSAPPFFSGGRNKSYSDQQEARRIAILENTVFNLKERIANMERDFAYHVHNVETHVHRNEVGK